MVNLISIFFCFNWIMITKLLELARWWPPILLLCISVIFSILIGYKLFWLRQAWASDVIPPDNSFSAWTKRVWIMWIVWSVCVLEWAFAKSSRKSFECTAPFIWFASSQIKLSTFNFRFYTLLVFSQTLKCSCYPLQILNPCACVCFGRSND